MKRLMAVTAILAVLGLSVGPAFAVVDPPKIPPKGQEGPGIRAKIPPKGTEGPDIRSNTIPRPKGLEGPDIR